MAITDHGKEWENDFRARWEAMDAKRACAWRFMDSSDLHGLNKRLVNVPPVPADFLLAYDGWLGLADCKATFDPRGFNTKLVKPPQIVAAVRSLAAGTPYVFPVKSMARRQAFFVPGRFVLAARGVVPWDDLAPFHWPEGSPCPIGPT